MYQAQVDEKCHIEKKWLTAGLIMECDDDVLGKSDSLSSLEADGLYSSSNVIGDIL